jgi:V8-like Glu-specific endopeptidase
MKTKIQQFAFVVLITTFAYAQDTQIPLPTTDPFAEPGTESRGVFGGDDRKDVNDVLGFEHYTRATAVMIKKNVVQGNRIYGNTLRQNLQLRYWSNRFDENVKFLDQPAIANCTGFLVAPDLLVSAGHCLLTNEDAKNYYWLFDYTNKLKYNKDGFYIEFDQNDLYEIKEIVGGKYEGTGDNMEDYVMMRLKRKSDRLPYRVRSGGTPTADLPVYTIGSPSGLPLKVITNSKIVDYSPDKWFKTDIDVFQGNSGGPVFDRNGWIEGIVVRTAAKKIDGFYTADYMYDRNCKCIKTIEFNDASYNAGGQVHKINKMPLDMLKTIIYENLVNSIKTNNYDEFDRWADYEWMFKDKYLGNRIKPEKILIAETRNSMTKNQRLMLMDMIKINSGTYDKNFEHGLVELIFNYQDDDLQSAGAEYLDIDVSPYGKTLLRTMVEQGNMLVVRDLMSHGANYTKSDTGGNNLLHVAAMNGHEKVARMLIEAGVDLDQKNNRKWRPEKVARKAGYKDLGRMMKKERKKRR